MYKISFKHSTLVLKPESLLERKLSALKLTNVLHMTKKEKNVFKAQSSVGVLIELYGTTTLFHFLLHLIPWNVKLLLVI